MKAFRPPPFSLQTYHPHKTNASFLENHAYDSQVKDFLPGEQVFVTSMLAGPPSNSVSAQPLNVSQRDPFVLLTQRAGNRTRASDYADFIRLWARLVRRAGVPLPADRPLLHALVTDNSKPLRTGLCQGLNGVM
jgi:hypothetical protein